MAGKFKNETIAAAAENGDDLFKNLNKAVYNENTPPEKKMQIRLMCSWGFSESLIKYLLSRIKNFSIRDLDFIRICCIFLPEDACESFCKKHFNNEFEYEPLIDELAEERIRQRFPSFNFDELSSLKEKNDGLKAALDLHKQYLYLLQEQASLTRAGKDKSDSTAEEIASWKNKAESSAAELKAATDKLDISESQIEELKKELSAAEDEIKTWKEKAEEARKELEKFANEIPELRKCINLLTAKVEQAGSGNGSHMAQIDSVIKKTLVCVEAAGNKDEQYHTKIMKKLEEILELQKQSRKRSGSFMSLFGKNEYRESDGEDPQNKDSEKQAFIEEIMAEFSERHYAVLGYLLDLLPVTELRFIANPDFDDMRLKFISEWYCKKHGISFNYEGIVSNPQKEEYTEGPAVQEEYDIDEEIITEEEDEDD